MIVIPNEQLIAVDIDDTLVHLLPEMVDPYGDRLEAAYTDFTLQDPYGILRTMSFQVNWPNVNIVKRGHARGHRYFAWSVAGVKHAVAVIAALEMDQYFEFVCSKPRQYIDDKDVTEWIGSRTWLPANFAGWDKETV